MAENGAMTDGLILQIRDKNGQSVLRQTQRREAAARRHLTVKITDSDRNPRADSIMEWQPIATAPFDRDLELAVINYNGTTYVRVSVPPHSRRVVEGGNQHTNYCAPDTLARMAQPTLIRLAFLFSLIIL
jgi:hypothetical protein